MRAVIMLIMFVGLFLVVQSVNDERVRKLELRIRELSFEESSDQTAM